MLSGGGSFAKFGTGIATLLDGGFGGAVELLSGSVRNEAIPFAVAEAGQTLTAGGQGIVARTAADAGVFADDARGIGYKGTNYLYLCRGDATGELVANGGFESGAASWTFSGGAATASANSLWIENVANTPPQGADCAVIGGRGAASGAVAQDVAFPAAGRYELKFRIRRFRENPFTEDTKVSVFRAAVGGETIHMSYIQRNEDERVERPERRRSGMTGFKGTSTCSAEA